MDLRAISETVPKLMIEGRFAEAEALLDQAHADAASQSDLNALEQVCSLLVQVHCSWQFEHIGKAEQFSIERERISPSAYNGLQTAMVLYHVARQPSRAAEKLARVIESGRSEGDLSTVYSALALMGQSYLDLDRITEASKVLKDLETMLSNGCPVVIGDETTFLERALAREIDRPKIHRVATIALSRCRDAGFKARLGALLITGA